MQRALQAAEKVETSYLCEACGKRVEGIWRRLSIKAVGRYFLCQLQRFIYDVRVRIVTSFDGLHEPEHHRNVYSVNLPICTEPPEMSPLRS